MWFKNIQLLQFLEPVQCSAEEIEVQLQPLTFKPCPKSLPMTMGWCSPLGNGDSSPLVFSAQHHYMFCMRVEERVVPPAVLREQLQIKIAEIEVRQDRKVPRDEKERLSDEIYQSLLIRAFTKSSYVHCYIDKPNGFIVINTASQKHYQQVISLLGKSLQLGNFSAPAVESVSAHLTRWLKYNDSPSSLCIEDACLVKDTGENGSTVRFKQHDLHDKNVKPFLQDNCIVTQLALEWRDKMRFTLKENFLFSGVKFLEAVKDLAKDGLGERQEERFMADFIIMAETLSEFFNDLLPHFLENKKPAEVKFLAA